ncbi:unnamed protein product [Macrosiphum euphorbiae]|uniref:Uncharacterized protein n=1 Tax=Macrosiphum euphorbiae TaxID=13131 RepID=A0AAV0W6V8_9HEMI|nr:unnamed protein product [Macrosiphum euphorbiae]
MINFYSLRSRILKNGGTYSMARGFKSSPAGRPVIASFGNHCTQLFDRPSGLRTSHLRRCRTHRRPRFPLVDHGAVLRAAAMPHDPVAYSHSIRDVVSIRPVCLSFFLTAACLASSIPVCTAPRSL